MNLDFSVLARPIPHRPPLAVRGQVGTVGTQAFTRVAARSCAVANVGTGGDIEDVGALRPRVSPARPLSPDTEASNEINVSPASPFVPTLAGNTECSAGFDREAFDERAAIMEFDGGMTRANAEAAALALLTEAERGNERDQP